MPERASIRIGVIGLGLISQVVHLPNLLRDPSFEVAHVCDLSPTVTARIAAGLPGEPRQSTDWVHVCDDADLDAVLVATPGTHTAIVRAALEGGRHVLSEKPLAVTQADAIALGTLARDAGRILQVGFMKAYDPAMARAREAIADIGAITLVRITVRHPSDERQTDHLDVIRAGDADRAAIAAAIAAERASAIDALGEVPDAIAGLYTDLLLGSVSHELAALRGLGIDPPAAFDHGRAWPFDAAVAAESPPSIMGRAHLRGGAELDLEWLWLPEYPTYDERITVLGTAGAVSLRMPQPYGPNVSADLEIRLADGIDERVTKVASDWDSGFRRELSAFAQAIHDDRPPLTDAFVTATDTAALQSLTARIAERHGVAVGGEAAAIGSRH